MSNEKLHNRRNSGSFRGVQDTDVDTIYGVLKTLSKPPKPLEDEAKHLVGDLYTNPKYKKDNVLGGKLLSVRYEISENK